MDSSGLVGLELLKNGKDRSGDSGLDPTVLPEWMDRDRFSRGQRFFTRHCFAIVFALHCSLTVGFSVKNLLEPLVFTGRSCTASKALMRYLETFVHLFLWHTEDVWDPNSLGYASLMKVRRMHAHVRKMMHKHEEGTTERLSQYDMAIVQAGFMAVPVMYPHSFGIKTTTEELEDYIFFWRGIGYLLGLEDEFNVCTRVSYAETYSLCKEIEEKEVLYGLLNPPKDFDLMAQAYIEGTNEPAHFRLNTVEAIVSFTMQISGHHMWERSRKMSLADRCRVRLYRLIMWCIRYLPGFETYNNFMFIRSMKPAFDTVYKQLKYKQS